MELADFISAVIGCLKLPKYYPDRARGHMGHVLPGVTLRRTSSSSEFRYLREIEVVHLHRRHNHVERLLATGPHRGPQSCNILQHIYEALVEAEIPHSAHQLPVLDEEGTIAGHAGKDLLVRIDLADIPQTCDENPAFGRGYHLVNSLRVFV